MNVQSFESIVVDVLNERVRQEQLHGDSTCANPRVPNFERLAVLVEEVGEVAKDTLEHDRAPDNTPALRFELVQCAAVCVAWIEGLDARSHPAAAPAAEIETGRP